MPTGYTSKLMAEEQSFPEFVLGCARAFGALIAMRDSPNGTPIPEKFYPSDYHAKKVVLARKELKRLKAMKHGERLKFGQSAKEAAIKHNEQWLKKDKAENDRLLAMAQNVIAWNPPTKDHQGLKEFMLQQLDISRNDLDYMHSQLEQAKERPALTYYITAVSDAAHAIEYHTKENAKEIEIANTRSEWVRLLRLSL